jgi:hypothetical protein
MPSLMLAPADASRELQETRRNTALHLDTLCSGGHRDPSRAYSSRLEMFL